MLIKVDDTLTKSKYLLFRDAGKVAPGRKTHKYEVTSVNNSTLLGYVKWFGAWRRYCFFTISQEIILDYECMSSLSEFVQEKTAESRQKNIEAIRNSPNVLRDVVDHERYQALKTQNNS